MNPIKLIVLDSPGANHLRKLDAVKGSIQIVISSDAGTLSKAVPDADVILVNMPHGKLLREIFPLATRLRWVHTLYAGVEKTLFPELVKSSVILTNARGVFKRSLAEFVTASVLYFAKDFRRLIRNQQAGVWEHFITHEAHGTTMGIVGYGETGRTCAQQAHALGMKVLGLRRRPELSAQDPLLEAVMGPNDLQKLLAQSDYVVFAAPATAQTRKLMGKPEFDAMKPSAVFINVGRGSSVDEAAIIDALQNGRLHGAALDVFETEPLPAGHPFYKMENVLLSPHCTDHTPDFEDIDMDYFMENLQKYMKDEPLGNVVDKEAGY